MWASLIRRRRLCFMILLVVTVTITGIVASVYFAKKQTNQVFWYAPKDWPSEIRLATKQFSQLPPETRGTQGRELLKFWERQQFEGIPDGVSSQIFYVSDIKAHLGPPSHDAGSVLLYEVYSEEESEFSWSILFRHDEDGLFYKGGLVSVGSGPGSYGWK